MKNIIDNISGNMNEKIQAIFSLASRGNAEINIQPQVECNYANDYYGDQQCQLKASEQ